MVDEKIRGAFQKVKEDMNSLHEQLNHISKELNELKRTLSQTDKPTNIQTDGIQYQTQPPTYQTDAQAIQTNAETAQSKQPIGGPESKDLIISTGNRGVQTDRQTNRQTDRQPYNSNYQPASQPIPTSLPQKFVLNQVSSDPIGQIEKVTEIINSLDALKKDLRKQFKLLTSQEMLVFSAIYQLTSQKLDVDYSILSKKINLSESSIRDYVQKIIKKGIPLEKTRENNKRILLTIPPEFKRMASLETIISLREL